MDLLAALWDPQTLAAALGLPLATLVYTFAGGFVPVFNIEIYLVAVSSLASGTGLLVIASMAAVGQMVAKSLVYGAGRGTLSTSLGRYEERRRAMIDRLDEREGSTGLLLFVSAALGLPPFYVASGAAGALAFPYPSFLLAGIAGSLLRFGLVLATGSAAIGWVF